MTNFFSNLPVDIVAEISSHLSLTNNVNLASINTGFFNNYPWHILLQKRYDIKLLNKENAREAVIALRLYEKNFNQPSNLSSNRSCTEGELKALTLLNKLSKCGEVWAGIYLSKTARLSIVDDFINLSECLTQLENSPNCLGQHLKLLLSEALLNFGKRYLAYGQALNKSDYVARIDKLLSNLNYKDDFKNNFIKKIALFYAAINSYKFNLNLDSINKISDFCKIITMDLIYLALSECKEFASNFQKHSRLISYPENTYKKPEISKFNKLRTECINLSYYHLKSYQEKIEMLKKEASVTDKNITQIFNQFEENISEIINQYHTISETYSDFINQDWINHEIAHAKFIKNSIREFRYILLDIYFTGHIFTTGVRDFDNAALNLLIDLKNNLNNEEARERLFKIYASGINTISIDNEKYFELQNEIPRTTLTL